MVQEKAQQHQKSTSQSCNITADADAVAQCLTDSSIVGFSLDVLVKVLVLALGLSLLDLALLRAGRRLLWSGLLGLLRGLRSVLSVGRVAGSLGRHGDIVLGRKTRVALSTGRLSVTCQAVRSGDGLTRHP